eukprot:3622487-Lingulodinium_polyedra.AAC.1
MQPCRPGRGKWLKVSARARGWANGQPPLIAARQRSPYRHMTILIPAVRTAVCSLLRTNGRPTATRARAP